MVFPSVSVTVVSGGGGLGAKVGESRAEVSRSWRLDTSLGWRVFGEGGSAGSSTAVVGARETGMDKYEVLEECHV